MTKVCHMTSVHNSNDVRIFYKECTSLAAAGYDVYLVAPGVSREENGVHVVGVGEKPQSRLERMFSFSQKVYEKAKEIDAAIYHFHDPELLPYGLKLKKLGKKVIFDSHENYPAQINEKYYLPFVVRKVVKCAYEAYETHVLRHIDAAIIPCTFDGWRDIFAGRAQRTVIVSNAVDLQKFQQVATGDVQLTKENRVCYIGTLSEDRGITNLIRACAKAQVKLLLAGAFTNKEYELKLRAMPEFANVEYLGIVPNTQVYGILQSCTIGAQILLNVGQYYHGDNFGVKVYEFMYAKLPIITNDSPYNVKTFAKYHCGICVDPSDVDAVAKAITYLLDHPQEAQEMGRNGRRAVEEEFNWQVEEKKLVGLYRELEG